MEKSTYEKMGQKVVTHIMNPKAMDKKLLLGNMDHDTREWTDGVLTASARQVVKEQGDVKCWIVCDGDIDQELRAYQFWHECKVLVWNR